MRRRILIWPQKRFCTLNVLFRAEDGGDLQIPLNMYGVCTKKDALFREIEFSRHKQKNKLQLHSIFVAHLFNILIV